VGAPNRQLRRAHQAAARRGKNSGVQMEQEAKAEIIQHARLEFENQRNMAEFAQNVFEDASALHAMLPDEHPLTKEIEETKNEAEEAAFSFRAEAIAKGISLLRATRMQIQVKAE